ncbi:MAG: L-rhamnose mutarotase [Cyclobacteriaceae bacterium]|nr:L-rhamnose mutarotase [Cyclobacteriaceae bacterium HetDA_MAG_MS6]
MQVICFTLDLKDDPHLIKEYEMHHQKVWPEVIASIKDSGIKSMQIYRLDTRLFMRIEAGDDFSLEEKSKADAANEKVQEWETLMWQYQQQIEGSRPGEKWRLMKQIFELSY